MTIMMSESLKERLDPNIFIQKDDMLQSFCLSISCNNGEFNCDISSILRSREKIKIAFFSERRLTSLLMSREFSLDLLIKDGSSSIFEIGKITNKDCELEIGVGPVESHVSIIIDFESNI